MDRYLHHPIIDVESPPLEWWSNVGAGGNIVTSSRSSLKPDSVNQLVFLATKLK